MRKIFNIMTKNFMVSLMCLCVFRIRSTSSLNLFVSIYLYIFDSMLKIFIMPSNREQTICDNMRKILSTMTQISMMSLVCLCVLLEMVMKTGNTLFIEVSRCCGPHKLSVQYGPYRKILS